jgi:hypothetical protein
MALTIAHLRLIEGGKPCYSVQQKVLLDTVTFVQFRCFLFFVLDTIKRLRFQVPSVFTSDVVKLVAFCLTVLCLTELKRVGCPWVTLLLAERS